MHIIMIFAFFDCTFVSILFKKHFSKLFCPSTSATFGLKLAVLCHKIITHHVIQNTCFHTPFVCFNIWSELALRTVCSWPSELCMYSCQLYQMTPIVSEIILRLVQLLLVCSNATWAQWHPPVRLLHRHNTFMSFVLKVSNTHSTHDPCY